MPPPSKGVLMIFLGLGIVGYVQTELEYDCNNPTRFLYCVNYQYRKLLKNVTRQLKDMWTPL